MRAALILLFSLHASAAPEACTFPEKAEIKLVESLSPDSIAVVEARTRCLYVVDPAAPRVRRSKPLPSLPSDMKFHPASRKIFFYYPENSSLSSLDPTLREEKIEVNFTNKEFCEREVVGNMTATTCQKFENENYRILPGGDRFLLSAGPILVHVPIQNPSDFSVTLPPAWHFVREVKRDPTSGLLLALKIYPMLESEISWALLNRQGVLLSPLPAVSIVQYGVKSLTFFPGGESFLTNTGLVFRTTDLSPLADLHYQFEDAYFAGNTLITVKEEERESGLFKAMAFDQDLTPLSFEYFFQRPLLIAQTNAPNSLLYVFSTGNLKEIFRVLPLRKEIP